MTYINNKFMLYLIRPTIVILVSAFLIAGCGEADQQNKNNSDIGEKETHDHEHSHDDSLSESVSGMNVVHLSDRKVKNLGIKTDTIPYRQLSGIVKANGRLRVPPQHEATVTPMLGGNIHSIKVIEGDRISKGQTLAYLSHVKFTQLQAEYAKLEKQLDFLKEEYQRQKSMYDQEVGSGKSFQKAKSDYLATQVEIEGMRTRLRQLNINPDRVKEGEITEYIPVLSPIDGYIEKVLVQTGQFVASGIPMFKIVNNEHVHADLMVFEKDFSKVKKGQKIKFKLQSSDREELNAKIFSVGKRFEKEPRAIHIHAEIIEKRDFLIPGLYINGEILIKNHKVRALPDEAIVEEDGKSYIFAVSKHKHGDIIEWEFTPTEVTKGKTHGGWTEVKAMREIDPGIEFVWDNAYYLVSEMAKGDNSHGH